MGLKITTKTIIINNNVGNSFSHLKNFEDFVLLFSIKTRTTVILNKNDKSIIRLLKLI